MDSLACPDAKIIDVVTEERQAPEIDSESDLPWLHAQVCAIGRPFYHMHDDGKWTVTVNIPTDRPGCTAEVNAGHGQRFMTLSEALRAVLEKCR